MRKAWWLWMKLDSVEIQFQALGTVAILNPRCECHCPWQLAEIRKLSEAGGDPTWPHHSGWLGGSLGWQASNKQTDWPRCWVVIWLLWTCCSVRLILCCWCCSWLECEYSWVEYCCTCCCWCCCCCCSCWFGFCRCILIRYISLYIIENDNQIDAVSTALKWITPLDHLFLYLSLLICFFTFSIYI